MCSLMKNLSNAKRGKEEETFHPRKTTFVPRHRHRQWQREREEEKRSFALENAFIAAIFLWLYWLSFSWWASGMIYEYWLRLHGLADYVTKKEQILLCLAINIFPLLFARQQQQIRPLFYVYLYWAHKSNGKTWIWMGKMLRAIYGE